MRGRIVILIAVVLCVVPMIARAAVTNGGFETGDLTGWTLAGQGFAQTAASGVTPTVGTYEAELDTTGNFTVLAPAVASSLGVSGSAIFGLGQGSPTNGTCISQSVTVSPGDVLSFDWNVATDELNEDPMFNDFAFYTIDSSAFLLASRNASTWNIVSPPAGYDGQTNYATQIYTFSTGGTHTIGFAVLNVGDAGHNTALFLDNLSIPGVPEPACVSTMLCLASGWFFRRKRY